MACTDRAGFRDALALPCTTWTSPQCQNAVARSLEVHGAGCLRYPLFDLGSAPPLASYVCPRATAEITRRTCVQQGPPPGAGATTATDPAHAEARGVPAVAVAVPLLAVAAFAKPRVASWAMRPHEFDFRPYNHGDMRTITVKPRNVAEGLQYRAMEAGLIR